MDDILDIIEDTAQLLFLYDVGEVGADARKLADINYACTQKVQSVVGMLPDMKHASAMLVSCDEIDRYESEADHVMRAAIARLFRDEADVRQLIKMRTIYEHLEAVTDACEDVATCRRLMCWRIPKALRTARRQLCASCAPDGPPTACDKHGRGTGTCRTDVMRRQPIGIRFHAHQEGVSWV